MQITQQTMQQVCFVNKNYIWNPRYGAPAVSVVGLPYIYVVSDPLPQEYLLVTSPCEKPNWQDRN